MKYLLFSVVAVGLLMSACQNSDPKMESEEIHGLDLSNMDTIVNPSEDFFRYANGAWLDASEIPADRGRWGSFDELRKNTIEDVLAVLEEAEASGSYDASTDQGKAVAFYYTAMDTAHTNALGITPLQPYIDAIMSAKSKDELQGKLSDQAALNGSFFGMGVQADLNNSSMNAVYLSPGALGLPDRDYYTKEDEESVRIQNAYKEHLAQMHTYLGLSEEEARSVANDIYNFEYTIATPRLTKVQKRNTVLLNNPRSIEEVKSMSPAIDWDALIASLDAPDFDTMIVTEPKYMEEINRIWAETPLTTLQSYARWTLLNQFAGYLSDDIVAQNFDFYGKTLKGTPEMKARWERVLGSTNGVLGEALGKLYVEKHFPPEAKKVAEEMVADVLSAFGERIEQLDWMSDSTKLKAQEKLDNFSVKIGYPDEWKDYSSMDIKSVEEGGSYASNVMAASQWSFRDNISKIGQKVDKSEWYMAPQTVNAYYNPLNNEIVFPAAILQPPFYDYQADAAVNFGGIGAVIGHEVSHGFDDSGSRFDAKGNLSNWWGDKDLERFQERTGKLVAQFDAYEPLPDLNVNGEFTLGENIGDLGGVNAAFDGLQKYWARHGKPEASQGFSPEQRFFLSWATIWRMKMRDEELRTRIATDPHSPGQYRAIGPLVNVDAFYEAFDIKEGDAMYKPESDRVKIW